MRSKSPTRLYAVGVASLVAVGTLSVADVGEEDNDARLVGYFADASPLDPGSEIRAAGVRVGTVESITLDNDVAKVEFDIDPSVLPVHADASLVIKPINVLGEMYVDLNEGSPDAPMLESGEIPMKQTRSSVTLQDVLNTFDNPTATGLAGLIETLGTGMEGSGAEISAALSKLAPSMAGAEAVGDILDAQIAALTQVVDRVHPVADELADERGRTLDKLVGNTTTALDSLAQQHDALNAGLVELPATLDSVVATLNGLSDVASEATPVLKSLRPVTDNLVGISKELRAFSEAANPALERLTPVVSKAGALIEDAAPVATQLRAAGGNLKASARGLRPLGSEVLDKNLYGLMEFVRKWALSTNDRDGLGHFFRGVFHVTPASLNSLLGADVVPGVVGGPKKGPGKTSGVPKTRGNLDLPKLPLDLDRTIDDLLSGLLPRVPGGKNGALGLTSNQETNLLNQLLGGK